jgi:CRISPR-associated protein Csb2
MMLTIHIEYLTGYAVATNFADRNRAEWPPHPARVFMAMGAAYFETGEDGAECDALKWLEKQGDPVIFASSHASERTIVSHFVPVNDVADPFVTKKGKVVPQSHIPGTKIGRIRQERLFPRVRPDRPVVGFRWEADPDVHTRAALEQLCAKVTRVGHSSSLVWMWVADDDHVDPILDAFHADPGASTYRLRRITEGSLDELRDRFRAADQAEFDRLSDIKSTTKGKAKIEAANELTKRFNGVRPQPVRPEFRLASSYRVIVPDSMLRSVWDDQLIVYGLQPHDTQFARLDIVASSRVAQSLRDAAMSVLRERANIPECLSGHAPDGSSSQQPHAAFVALPFVAARHADGHLMGAAVAMPRTASGRERQHILGAIAGVERLTLSKLGAWRLVPVDELGYRSALDERNWTAAPRGAMEWASVTPIAFDAHAKSKDRSDYLAEVAEMIAVACERVGLPRPIQIAPSHVSAHEGAPTAREFLRLQRKDGSERRHLHARIWFDRPVVGPVLLGAGRYRGYGLMRPVLE